VCPEHRSGRRWPTPIASRRVVTVAGVLLACVLAACGGSSDNATKSAALPGDFLGMVSNDAFAASGPQRAQILAAERRTGVELLRQTFDWASIETRRGHFDFAVYDGYMAATARAGLTVLPVVFGLPSFEAGQRVAGARVTATTTFAPADVGDFAAFAAVLARRYGPGGTFWRSHPALPARPIRSWQIWNEPNLPVYWGGRPNARAYVALLRATAAALRTVDPGAEIVTAGIPDSTLGVPLERFVSEMLAAGGRGSFGTLAINPYAASSAGVIAATTAVRRLLDRAGLRALPIWVTEVGWSSGGPGSSFTVGPKRQAENILVTITSLASLAARLHIRGVVYFNWRDALPYAGGVDFWGLHTGLLTLSGTGKPALSAYYQAAGVLRTLPSQAHH
jgi:polysaccharide biosynthesis protein PslG